MTGSIVLYKKANMANMANLYSDLILHQAASLKDTPHPLTSHNLDTFYSVAVVCGLNHADKPFY